jgi:CheY-like chemotaxis protein
MGRGTGLGLSTVYGIIKQHNGWIDVYSEPEQGSVFNIYLPVSEKEKKRISEKRSPEKFQGNGERILFVEDEKIIRNVAVDMLTRKGYVVFAAHNTENATKIFKKEHGNFDLMISDVVLPDENGLILASRLLSENPDLPIIMISGYTEQKSHWMSIKEMGLEFLQKPFTLIQLLEIINKVLTEIETE